MPPKNPHDVYTQAAHDSAAQNNTACENEPSLDITDEETQQDEPSALPHNLEELCKEHICPACPQKIEATEVQMRAMAEMENFKKRLKREHEEQLAYAAERVLADLLPSLDNLDLALRYGNSNDACKDMLMGVEMTHKLLLEAVKQHGLEPVGEIGQEFTPELHEALSFEIRDDMEEGLVSTLMQCGYKLKGRLLRPAKVCISKKA